MKRVKDYIKLTNLNSERLNEKVLSNAIGGIILCHCGCFYSECGGSSRSENWQANTASGLSSPLPPDGAVLG